MHCTDVSLVKLIPKYLPDPDVTCFDLPDLDAFFFLFFRYFIVDGYKHNWFLYVELITCNFTEFVD